MRGRLMISSLEGSAREGGRPCEGRGEELLGVVADDAGYPWRCWVGGGYLV